MFIEEILKKIRSENNSALFYTPSYYKGAKSFIFTNPTEEIKIFSKEKIAHALKKIDELILEGYSGYGLLSFEAGYSLEEKLNSLIDENSIYPYIKFYFFDPIDVHEVFSDKINFCNQKKRLSQNLQLIDSFDLNTKKNKYINDIKKIKCYIKEGDTYQVNYTVNANFNIEAEPEILFMKLLFNQSAKYSAFINGNENIIISVSPELFFKTSEKKITATPMKGTYKRGKNLNEDKLHQILLTDSVKDMAENIMIVDLLRNDIGKISEIDSIKPKNVYNIEKYESVYQMVSTIEGALVNACFSNIIQNIFPCGSITGAPKIRTMEIIKELEESTRNLYTGALGMVHNKKMTFNVPIRTLEISKKTNSGTIGIGSGVVWDSDPEAEYEETLLKAKFLTEPKDYFEIFESILIENGKVYLPELHLRRIKQTADFFLFKFDEQKYDLIFSKILTAIDITKKYKLKLSLDKWGQFEYDLSEIKEERGLKKISISESRIDNRNAFQYFKTTNRKTYTKELSSAVAEGYFDVIFFNTDNELCEGARTNIFLLLEGKWYTPPIRTGILDGCYRKIFIEKYGCQEKILCFQDLLDCEKIILTNSVRKEIEISGIYSNKKQLKVF